jgi:TrmH family RNA methyltransferase
LAVVEQKKWTLDDIKEGLVHLAVLDRVQDPGNIGTIIRTAEAAGWDGILVLSGSADIYAPKVVRSTMGTMLHLPVVRGLSEEDMLSFVEERDIRLYATSVVESKTYDACDFTQSAAVVFGNEGAGVSDTLLARADERMHIPLFGRVESLNVAAAAAVICFEGARQRQSSC